MDYWLADRKNSVTDLVSIFLAWASRRLDTYINQAGVLGERFPPAWDASAKAPPWQAALACSFNPPCASPSKPF
ncbi:MAG: hypothetical protein ABL889_16615 [Terricaulis sp.]